MNIFYRRVEAHTITAADKAIIAEEQHSFKIGSYIPWILGTFFVCLIIILGAIALRDRVKKKKLTQETKKTKKRVPSSLSNSPDEFDIDSVSRS